MASDRDGRRPRCGGACERDVFEAVPELPGPNIIRFRFSFEQFPEPTGPSWARAPGGGCGPRLGIL
eukprot:10124032-Alexandrium_andersonii.AAC.1